MRRSPLTMEFHARYLLALAFRSRRSSPFAARKSKVFRCTRAVSPCCCRMSRAAAVASSVSLLRLGRGVSGGRITSCTAYCASGTWLESWGQMIASRVCLVASWMAETMCA